MDELFKAIALEALYQMLANPTRDPWNPYPSRETWLSWFGEIEIAVALRRANERMHLWMG